MKKSALMEADFNKDFLLKIAASSNIKLSNYKSNERSFKEYLQFTFLFSKFCISTNSSYIDYFIGIKELIIYKNTSQSNKTMTSNKVNKKNETSRYSLIYQNKNKLHKIFNYFNPLFNEIYAISADTNNISKDSNKFSSFFKSSFQKAYNTLTNNTNNSDKEKNIYSNENISNINNYSLIEKLLLELSKKHLDNSYILLQIILISLNLELNNDDKNGISQEESLESTNLQDNENKDKILNEFENFLLTVLLSICPFLINKKDFIEYKSLKDDSICIISEDIKKEYVFCTIFDYIFLKSINEIKDGKSSFFNSIISKLSIGKLESDIKNDQLIDMFEMISKYIILHKNYNNTIICEDLYEFNCSIKENIANEIYSNLKLGEHVKFNNIDNKEDFLIEENSLKFINCYFTFNDYIDIVKNEKSNCNLKEYEEESNILTEEQIFKIVAMGDGVDVFYGQISESKNEDDISKDLIFGKTSLINNSCHSFTIRLKIEVNPSFYISNNQKTITIDKIINIKANEIINVISFIINDEISSKIKIIPDLEKIKISIDYIKRLNFVDENNSNNIKSKEINTLKEENDKKNSSNEIHNKTMNDVQQKKLINKNGMFDDLIIIEENEEEDKNNYTNNQYEMSMEDILAIQKLNQEDRNNYGAASINTGINTNAANAVVNGYSGGSNVELVEIECIKCGKKNIIIDNYLDHIN